MQFLITDKYNGHTVLSYLHLTLKISSNVITELKKDEHGIEVNGNHVTVRYILKTNDVLSINENDFEENSSKNIEPIKINLNIVYEDGNIIVIDKPPYMPTHPSHNHRDDSLANGLAYIYKKRNIPFVFRSIGRLDRNTSGLVMVSKNRIACAYMSNAKSKNKIQKRYIAILEGEANYPFDSYTKIETYIKRQQESIIVRVCCENEEEGDYALTEFKVLYKGNGLTVVEAIPKTGRTHQLRVHFAHIGFPIYGDAIYGNESPLIGRHALHAYNLTLPIPFCNKSASMYSYPPEDMQNLFTEKTGAKLEYIMGTFSEKVIYFNEEDY